VLLHVTNFKWSVGVSIVSTENLLIALISLDAITHMLEQVGGGLVDEYTRASPQSTSE
jgi:hypothetical protein